MQNNSSIHEMLKRREYNPSIRITDEHIRQFEQNRQEQIRQQNNAEPSFSPRPTIKGGRKTFK